MDTHKMIEQLENQIQQLDQAAGALRKAVMALKGLPNTTRASQTRAVEAPKKRKKVRGKAGTTSMILKVLPGKQLTTREVYEALKREGWKTTSGDPKALVGVTLRAMAQQGKVARIGNDWTLQEQQVAE